MVSRKALKKSMKKKRDPIEETESTSSRRNFLLKIWLGLAFVAVAELIWLVVSFLRPRKNRMRRGEFGTVMNAGPVDSFQPNSVTAFPRGHFYLTRLEDGGFLAIHRRCTHLGCTVPWNEEERQFLCPCHSSAFDIRGEVVRSPASRALDIFPITIENKVVFVDTGRAIRRSGFRSEQVAYPKKVS
jgi:cytochrome b6-f complex iron-sulfur subunit